MKKKILIIGNTPNVYALAKKLSEKHDIYCVPGCDTLKEFAECVDIREDSINELLNFVMENDIDMTVAISQEAINSDIVTKFTNNKQQIFAPTPKAHEIVTDKAFAKKFLYKLRIPTPKFGIFEKLNVAYDYIKTQKLPFVIKSNDNNSATIITSLNTCKNIVESIFMGKNNKLIVEDYIYGTPFSFYTITDGYKALPLGNSLIYRHSLDGDGGQLTRGMASCVPNYKLSIDNEYYIMDYVIYPVLEYLQMSGNPYLGILGVNGILTQNGDIFILGFESFLQDTDAAAIIDNIEDDLYNLFEMCIIGSFSDEADYIQLNGKQYVSITARCTNKNFMNNIISGINNLDEETITTYYPSIIKNRYLEYEASYGPVLILTSYASSLTKAKEKVYEEMKCIDYKGLIYRKDICATYNI